MSNLRTQWRQKVKDPCLMLSVCGLCLMSLPLIVGALLEHFTALTWLTRDTGLRDGGDNVRSAIATVFRCEILLIGMGFVVPSIGVLLILIAWAMKFMRRAIHKTRTAVNDHPAV